MATSKQLTGSKESFDTVSMEFREIIVQHLKLVRSSDEVEMNDMDQYEETEATNRQNLNVIAYCISFLIFNFIDVDPFVQNANISWVTKTVVKAARMTDRGRQLDKTAFYFFKDKLRDYLEGINAELTRIDGHAGDVWKHGYDKLDQALMKNGIQDVLN